MPNSTTTSHPARFLSRLASAVTLLAILVLGTGCETTGIGSLPDLSEEGRAERIAQSGDHAQAANMYARYASNATGTERDRLTMLAVEQWLAAGDVARATSAFNSVQQPAGGDALWLWNANKAAFALQTGNADEALSIIEPLSRSSLSLKQRLRVESLRADAWFMKGDPGRAVELLVQREGWLNTAAEREANEQQLWNGLLESDPQDLRSAADIASNKDVRGWLALGALAASTGQQGMGWSNGVQRWQQANPHHPANSILGNLDVPSGRDLDYPRQVALLLPLSGSAASAGEAIQNGFFGAYFATAGGLDDRQTIRVYDVAAEGGASAAYSTAVADGAEFVVGPLLRQNVAELANDILVPVPVLTLNYLPDSTLAPPGLYQFSLAPEDEAAAVAQRAILDGHTRALALVPSNAYGRRVFASFATAFEALGGTVLDSRSYTTDNPDYSKTIEDLMALSGSVQRYQRLRANLGGTLQYDPRRRQDAEFVFLAAEAPEGRLIKSQLKFHYSGDLPVYSTSSIYALDGRSDSDLNGVMFADAPWMIAPQPWIEQLPAMYAEYWPQHRRLGRLHAMGYDAYQLVGALFASRGVEMREINGATGQLYLDSDGRVHRYLAWGQFERGKPVPLPDPDGYGEETSDDFADGEVNYSGGTDSTTWMEPTQEL
jgi:hypothetical protein